MKSLLSEETEEKDIGMMYQLFDKDSNGVIDLAEFVGSLSDCPEEVLQVLNGLVSAEHYYKEISSEARFFELTARENNEARMAAFALISNMKF